VSVAEWIIAMSPSILFASGVFWLATLVRWHLCKKLMQAVRELQCLECGYPQKPSWPCPECGQKAELATYDVS